MQMLLCSVLRSPPGILILPAPSALRLLTLVAQLHLLRHCAILAILAPQSTFFIDLWWCLLLNSLHT
jgi:hypothetical protein